MVGIALSWDSGRHVPNNPPFSPVCGYTCVGISEHAGVHSVVIWGATTRYINGDRSTPVLRVEELPILFSLFQARWPFASTAHLEQLMSGTWLQRCKSCYPQLIPPAFVTFVSQPLRHYKHSDPYLFQFLQKRQFLAESCGG